MISCFSDTFIETDFSFLASERADGVVWVKAVPDPRRFGVAEVNPEGWVTRLVEKPQTVDNNLALVGCYYFRRSEDLMSAIEEQMQRNVQLKNEFFLADAVNIMLERKALFHPQRVETWLDTGTIEATLETNRYLLEKAGAAPAPHPARGPAWRSVRRSTLTLQRRSRTSVIGPHASLGADCRVSGSRIENSILDADCTVTQRLPQGLADRCTGDRRGSRPRRDAHPERRRRQQLSAWILRPQAEKRPVRTGRDGAPLSFFAHNR